MGEKYQQIVVTYLAGQFGVDGQDDTKLQQAFRREVVEVLERVASSI